MPTIKEQETKRQVICSFDTRYRGKVHSVGVGDGYVAGYLAGAAAEQEQVLAIIKAAQEITM